MASGIDARARQSIVRGYDKEIQHYIAVSDGLRALALFFDFVAEFAPNYEDRVLDLSERTQHLFAAEKPKEADVAAFKTEILALLARVVDFVAPQQPQEPTADEGDLVEIKKRLLSAREEKALVSATDVVRNLGIGNASFTLGPLSLHVSRGEVIGLVGHNGSGKTTLLRLLAGELAPSRGQVQFPGLLGDDTAESKRKNKKRVPDWPRIRGKIAFVNPQPPIIREKVETALVWTAIANGSSPSEAQDAANITLHKFGLVAHAAKRATDLSTGLKLRFEIARVLLTNPDLIVLDEPLANLDVVAQQTLLADLQMLAASMQRPRAIVISSQHIGEIKSISDRIVVLSNGKPLFIGRKDEIADKLGVHVFEIVAESKRSVLAAVGVFNPLEVVEMGISVVFVLPQSVTREQLLARLSSESVSLTGFQDLSKSAKALLFLDKLLSRGTIGGRPAS